MGGRNKASHDAGGRGGGRRGAEWHGMLYPPPASCE